MIVRMKGSEDDMTDEIKTKLRLYAQLLAKANERARLTGPLDPEVLMDEHFTDAMAALPMLPVNAKSFVDVGTGGGLPGMVWAICRPDLSGTLIDSISRKSALLAEIALELEIGNVEVACTRSEDFASEPGRRESFDIATARAVAASCVLAEYLSPLVRVGGLVIAFKGPAVRDELASGVKWRLLGLSAPTLRPYETAGKPRTLVIWRKTAPCPARFPRRPGLAEKKPWHVVRPPRAL